MGAAAKFDYDIADSAGYAIANTFIKNPFNFAATPPIFKDIALQEKKYDKRSEACEKHNIEIEQIFEQFKDRTLKRQQNTATAQLKK